MVSAMAATHSCLIHASPFKHRRFSHAPLRMVSPNTCFPLSSSFVFKATIVAARPPVVAKCLPRADEDTGPLPPWLREESMPNHVAVIMDGNRRWARTRGLSAVSGYEPGTAALKRLVELSHKWRIRVLTIFAFSSHNWVETDFLMQFFERGLRKELGRFMSKNIRVSFLGDRSQLPKPLQVTVSEVEETTKNNSQLHLILAINHSGQNDILQAFQNMALKVKDGIIQPEDIDKSLFERELGTSCTEFPYPDLLIRTSGDLRISDFLLWQLAYTELYFTNSRWPDFGEEEFVEALSAFQQRQKLYGGRSS